MPGRVRSRCPDDEDVLQHFGELPHCPSLCQDHKTPVELAAGFLLCGDTGKETPYVQPLANIKRSEMFVFRRRNQMSLQTRCEASKNIKTRGSEEILFLKKNTVMSG